MFLLSISDSHFIFKQLYIITYFQLFFHEQITKMRHGYIQNCVIQKLSTRNTLNKHV